MDHPFRIYKAAERRIRDQTACASGAEAEEETARAAEEGVQSTVIDLTGDDSDGEGYDYGLKREPSPDILVLDTAKPTSRGKVPPGGVRKYRPGSNSSATATATVSSGLGSNRIASASRARDRQVIPIAAAASISREPSHSHSAQITEAVQPAEWACAACTLLNPTLALQCLACLSDRPRDPSAGWTCLSCGEDGMEASFWTCRTCGWVKIES